MTRISKTSSAVGAIVFTVLLTGTSRADTVVQLPLAGLLDKRCVTTLTNGMIVPWTLHTDGLETLQNAFVTAAVAKLKGAPVANALPDDGRFAANDRHPEVVLNFSNDAPATSGQTHQVPPTTSISFAVPPATYSKFFLFFNGSHGGTMVTIALTYDDGMDMQEVMVPDYAAKIPADDPVIFNLASNLSKWSLMTTVTEAGGHNITGVELHPMPGKMLKGITFQRSADGFLVLWGATGVATGPVGGSSDGAAADAVGSDGGAGAVAVDAPGDGAGATDANASSGTGGQNGDAGAGDASTPGSGGAGTAEPSSGSGSGCRVGPAASGQDGDCPLWRAFGAFGAFLLRRSRRKRA